LSNELEIIKERSTLGKKKFATTKPEKNVRTKSNADESVDITNRSTIETNYDNN
jgi:hypothetical protein